MEELKLLVESIANLPDLAIWVIAMYFFFKLAIVGSIFGVARLFINKIYDSYKLKYHPKEIIEIEKETIRDVYNLKNIEFGKYTISKVDERLSNEICRLIKLMASDGYGTYIHDSDVNKLAKFVDKYKETLGDESVSKK